MTQIKKLLIKKWANAGVAMGEDETGKIIFVPYTCPGDIVQVCIVKSKPRYSMAVLDKIIEPSQYRTASICPYAGICGACSFQHVSYEQEIQAKEQILSEIFRTKLTINSLDVAGNISATTNQSGAENISATTNQHGAGNFAKPYPQISVKKSPQIYHYRNKVTFHAIYDHGKMKLGFAKLNSFKIIPISQCVLLPIALNQCKNLLEEIACTIPHIEDVVLRISRDQHQVLINVLGSKSQRNLLIERLEKHQAMILDFQRTFQLTDLLCYYNSQAIQLPCFSNKEYITAHINQFVYQISISDFFQVNYDVAEIVFQDMRQQLQICGPNTECSTPPLTNSVLPLTNSVPPLTNSVPPLTNSVPPLTNSVPPLQAVWDAYCGGLVIGIQLSHYAQNIIGWEVNQEAVLRANNNIMMNHIENARVYECDLSQSHSQWPFVNSAPNTSTSAPNTSTSAPMPNTSTCGQTFMLTVPLISSGSAVSIVLVLDPPREGARALCKQANRFAFHKILYMSCDPMTAQRDLAEFTNYHIISIQGYDMFPRTHHVEILIVLEKN